VTEHLAGLDDEEVLATYADPDVARRLREAAFTELVDRFQRRVFAVCRRTLAGDVTAAEEVTQEVFLRLARSADTFRGDAKLSTWLYAVARNVATDRVRHDARRPATPVADIGEVSAGSGAEVAEDHLAAVETAGDLRTALAQLDGTSRILLLLVAIEGLTYTEAAAALDLPVGTVKSRVSRARVQLGHLLAEADARAGQPIAPREDRPHGDLTAGGGPSPRGPPGR
jgi:RNA polymerase sigma-70 factor, ECF subfamily